MNKDINTLTITGRFCYDHELKGLPGGQTVLKNNLAIGADYINEGQKTERTFYVDIEAWGKLAEVTAQYAKKGSWVVINGSIKQDQWTDKDTGSKRSKVYVLARDIKFGPKPKSDANNDITVEQPDSYIPTNDISDDAIDLSNIPF
jgi:single-strand DNA-binding protein